MQITFTDKIVQTTVTGGDMQTIGTGRIDTKQAHVCRR